MPNRKIPQSPKAPAVPYGASADAVRISIQCAAESHAHRPWLIASFYRDPEAPHEARWASGKNYWRNGEHVANLTETAYAALVGDKVVTSADYKADPTIFDNGSRSRYSFKCAICGLSVSRRSEAVYERFDRLAQAGVSEISLQGLAAILE